GNNASVLLGNGDGTFAAAIDYGTGANPTSVAIGDFDMDGRLDLAVSRWNGNDVSVLLGDGSGAFGATTSYGAAPGTTFAAIRDLNGDSLPDLISANGASDNISVLLATGSPNPNMFAAAVNYPVGDGPWSIAFGDI